MLAQYLITSHILGHVDRISCCRLKEDHFWFLSSFFMEAQKPKVHLKEVIAKVWNFLFFYFFIFWLCLSFLLHIFFFYLHDVPFVVGFVILNEKDGPLVSIILLLKTGLDENKAVSVINKHKFIMSSSAIFPS